MRIAIVGTGISGLVCGHLLHRRHEIELFEAEPRIGGHANTLDVELDGERHAVDTGFIVYNERTYPLFTRLLAGLGVATQPSDMSFAVSCERSGVEWGSRGIGALLADPRNLVRPGFLRMLRDIPRFHRAARRLLGSEGEKASLGDWLCGAGFSQEFVEHYAIPMGAAIWSAAPGECLGIPAATFARFFENHDLLGLRPRIRWRTIVGGSRRYVDALAAPFRHRIRIRTPVLGVRRRRGAVEIVTAEGRRPFDRVLVASHGDQALRLLLDPSDAERQVLGAMRTQENEALLHTDASVMPRRRRAWASWNHRIPAGPRERVFVTYHMNRLQGIRSRRPLFVTLNGSDRVDPARALARLRYRHPVLDAGAIAAQKLRAHVDGVDRVHYCGAYWGYGFHEDGVRSALAACRRFGGSL